MGVRGLDKLRPVMRKVLKCVAIAWGDEEPVITSALEGTHSPGSYHYFGCGLDFRKPKDAVIKVGVLKDLLGSNYDVVIEKNHVHVEHDP
jgi:hypothetical protein